MCQEWEYNYCTYKGLEFIIHNEDGNELMFDINYKGQLLLLDLGDEMEIVT